MEIRAKEQTDKEKEIICTNYEEGTEKDEKREKWGHRVSAQKQSSSDMTFSEMAISIISKPLVQHC